MSTVVAFPKIKPRRKAHRAEEGATLFMHIRKTTLIAHIANPRADRLPANGKSGRV